MIRRDERARIALGGTFGLLLAVSAGACTGTGGDGSTDASVDGASGDGSTDASVDGTSGDGSTDASVDACDIGGTLYAAGAANPANACQICTPSVITSAWSPVVDGTSCGNGEVCTSGSCAAGCFIGNVLYGANNPNPTNACQLCQPAQSTTAWTNVADGTSCGTGGTEACSAGSCETPCLIGGTVYAANAVNPSNACQSCQPGVSTSAWSNVTDGTTCSVDGGAGELCAAGGCVTAACVVDGVAYPAGPNPSNSCQTCQPGTSVTAWTNVPDGTTAYGSMTCCGGVALDTTSDANNCGACGQVCTAGPSPGCSSSWCNYQVAWGNGSIAVDATNVYWTTQSGGTVMMVPIAGGTPATLASGQYRPSTIAVDATNVYWTNYNTALGTVMMVPIAGGAATTLASGQGGPYGIALDATNVYWTNIGPTTNSSPALMKVPIAGGTPATLASGGGFGIAVDASYVYWTANSTVMKVPIAGGAAATLASGQNGPYGLAVGAANVYWTDSGVAALMMAPK